VASGSLLALAAVGVHVKLVSADVNVQLELVELVELVELDVEGNFGVEILGVDSAGVDVTVAEAVGVAVGKGVSEVLVLMLVEVEMLWQ
jgi:hypothetical protein